MPSLVKRKAAKCDGFKMFSVGREQALSLQWRIRKKSAECGTLSKDFFCLEFENYFQIPLDNSGENDYNSRVILKLSIGGNDG